MTFIDLGAGFQNAREAEIVPEAMYDLTISKAVYNEEKGNIMCVIDIDNPPEDVNASPIFHYINLPKGEDEAKDDMSNLFIKRFLSCFGIEYEDTGFDTEAIIGATASNLNVGQDEYEGRIKNVLNLPSLDS